MRREQHAAHLLTVTVLISHYCSHTVSKSDPHLWHLCWLVTQGERHDTQAENQQGRKPWQTWRRIHQLGCFPYPFYLYKMSNRVRVQTVINFVFKILEYLQFDLLSSAFCWHSQLLNLHFYLQRNCPIHLNSILNLLFVAASFRFCLPMPVDSKTRQVHIFLQISAQNSIWKATAS